MTIITDLRRIADDADAASRAAAECRNAVQAGSVPSAGELAEVIRLAANAATRADKLIKAIGGD